MHLEAKRPKPRPVRRRKEHDIELQVGTQSLGYQVWGSADHALSCLAMVDPCLATAITVNSEGSMTMGTPDPAVDEV